VLLLIDYPHKNPSFFESPSSVDQLTTECILEYFSKS